MFIASSTYKSVLKKNIKTLQLGEERAYFYIQESKEKSAERCFFIDKPEVSHTAFGKINQQNNRLRKLKIRPFGKQALFSIGIIRKDENGLLTIETKKKNGISGTKLLRALKDLTDFRKYLRGAYLYKGEQQEDRQQDQPQETALLDPENLSPEVQQAIDHNIAVLDNELNKTAKKNKRGILRGFRNVLKKGRNFLGGVKDKIGHTLQAVGSLRPMIKDGRVAFWADADELFDLVDLSELLEFDREKSKNHIQVEIIKFPAKEIIIRSEPGKLLALKNLKLGEANLKSVEAEGMEIHLIQSKDGLKATIKAASLRGETLESESLKMS